MRNIDRLEDVFEILCNASSLGTLGFFVGAGFTKAVMENSIQETYSWSELLNECCTKMNIDASSFERASSYSEFASDICRAHSAQNGIEYGESVRELKNTISNLTNIYPENSCIDPFKGYFEKVKPNWIITTNYDTILETLFTGSALPLSSQEHFIKVKNLIPIYHIHGIRTQPDSIIITNEDYIKIFRPNDYRQARLPFLMKESIVLMLGYGLGDINVASALDWSRNVYTNTNQYYDSEIVQVLYTGFPSATPYRENNGVIIVETDSLIDFFDCLTKYYDNYRSQQEQKIEKINECREIFIQCEQDEIDKFIEDREERLKIVNFINSLEPEFSYIYPSFLNYLLSACRRTDEMSRPNGAFDAYAKKLKLLLDILKHINYSTIPTALFHIVAEAMNEVAGYVGSSLGKSWEADEIWQSEKEDIPEKMHSELLKYAERWQYHTLKELLS